MRRLGTLICVFMLLFCATAQAAGLNVGVKHFMQTYDEVFKGSGSWSEISGGYAKQSAEWAIALYTSGSQIGEVGINTKITSFDQTSLKQSVYPIGIAAFIIGIPQSHLMPLSEAISRSILSAKDEQLRMGNVTANITYHSDEKILEVHFVNSNEATSASRATMVREGRVKAENTGVRFEEKNHIKYLMAPVSNENQCKKVGFDLADSFSGDMKVLFLVKGEPVLAYVRQGKSEQYIKPDQELIKEVQAVFPKES